LKQVGKERADWVLGLVANQDGELMVSAWRFAMAFDVADRGRTRPHDVSRAVAKLEGLGLSRDQVAAADRRVSQATVTAKGKAMTDAVDKARERIVGVRFATWDDRDVTGTGAPHAYVRQRRERRYRQVIRCARTTMRNQAPRNSSTTRTNSSGRSQMRA
jgi:DNA-binding MarR family transcriptional regulator